MPENLNYKILCHECNHDVSEHVEVTKVPDEGNHRKDYIEMNGTPIYLKFMPTTGGRNWCTFCNCHLSQVQILLKAIERFLGLLGCTE